MERGLKTILTRDEDVLAAAEALAQSAGATSRSRRWSRPGARRRGRSAAISSSTRDGNFDGSVSGGCVEGAVIDRGGRRDRHGQAAGCSNSASPTRRPGGSGSPAAAASRSMSRGSTDDARCSRDHQGGAASAAPARSSPTCRRRASASSTAEAMPPIRSLPTLAGIPYGQDPARSTSDGEELFSHRSAPAPRLIVIGAVHICAGAGADGAHRRPRRRRSSIRARHSRRRTVFPTCQSSPTGRRTRSPRSPLDRYTAISRSPTIPRSTIPRSRWRSRPDASTSARSARERRTPSASSGCGARASTKRSSRASTRRSGSISARQPGRDRRVDHWRDRCFAAQEAAARGKPRHEVRTDTNRRG